MEDLFISSYDANSDHHLVIEGDEEAVWAYLLNADNQILLHGFLCSLKEPVDELEIPVDKGKPPPLVKRFANEYSVIPDLKEEQVQVKWSGRRAYVHIDECLYLVVDIDTRRAASKALSKPGQYGFPLE